MNRKFLSVVFIVLLISGLSASDALTLDEAKALSAETNKPLLLDFFTEW